MSRRTVYMLSEELAKACIACLVSNFPNLIPKVAALLPSNRSRSPIVHLLAKHLFFSSPSTSSSLRVINPTPASTEDLTAFHDPDYIQCILSIEEPTDGAEFGLEDDCPWFNGLNLYVKLVAGASLTAAHLLAQKSAEVAICWDGGRHHATRASAAGFCYVADAVLAILRLKRAPSKPRIMYIDLDLHHGDGVADAFANKLRSRRVFPQVLTLSIHHAAPGFYPAGPLANITPEDTPDPFTLSIPLEAGASAATFAQIWVAIEKIRASFAPEYVIVQCGVDGLAGDPCAKWNWCIDRQIEGSLGWCVERILQWNCGTLLLGGGMYLHYLRSPKSARGVVLSGHPGGYNPQNAARAWSYLTSIASGSPVLVDAPIPEHGQWPLYAPSFTMDVPAGNMSDKNTPQYLETINVSFEILANRIRDWTSSS